MILLILFCIIAETACQICFKSAADASSLKETLCKPIIWLGIILWGIEVVVWMHVLKTVPLTIAFPVMSLNYVAILLTSAWIFKEHITKRHAIGALFITMGVACIGATGI